LVCRIEVPSLAQRSEVPAPVVDRSKYPSTVMENTMLSPHEFATLLLLQDAPNQIEMVRDELDALLERQLVQLENLASGRQLWSLTASGDSTMKAIKRYS
jgi:hypothetical protein